MNVKPYNKNINKRKEKAQSVEKLNIVNFFTM